MESGQFFKLNIILSSNIIFFIGIVCFLVIGIICGLNFDGESYNPLWIAYYILILIFWISYILIKILVFPFFLIRKSKKTFSYKFLKKFLLNNNFRTKIFVNAIIFDFICNFIPLAFFIGILNNFYMLVTEQELTIFSFSNIVFIVFIYILSGTGVLLSYLSLIVWFKITNSLNKS